MNRQEYDVIPKICGFCKEKIPFEKRNNDFCNHTCFNKSTRKQRPCLYCGNDLMCSDKVKYRNKFCSHECHWKYAQKEFIEKWKRGEIVVVDERGLLNKQIRRYLFNKYLDACCKCGWHEKNKVTNKIPLQVNHIDGNHKNNNENNLELLCPNCHSLTPNFGSLNKGKGRNRYKGK